MAKSNGELLTKMSNGNNGAEKPLTVADQVGAYLNTEAMRRQIATALPKHLTPERLSRIALTTIRTTPALMQCTIESLLGAIMQAAQLGLEPGILGHCYFVPFNKNIAPKGAPAKWVKEVTFIIGYRGLIDLARRSGQITTIASYPIYSKDKFECVYGFEQKLFHEPSFGDRGELIGFYSYAITKDGGKFADVMSLDEVKRIRDRSKSKDNGPWVTDFEEMGRKTVLRRMCKYLPMSVEWQTLTREDEEKEFGDATAIELNLGDRKHPNLEGASWPALDANAQPALTQESLDEITQASNEKLLAKRKEVTTEDVVSLIPPGAGDEPGRLLYDTESDVKFELLGEND